MAKLPKRVGHICSHESQAATIPRFFAARVPEKDQKKQRFKRVADSVGFDERPSKLQPKKGPADISAGPDFEKQFRRS